ncbi:MAG: leucine-rich repeat domain-containing protein [Clostridia bacterium]|nr:leucine-rich repeat domain-containing protein [Clostridia bacterium]
MAKRVISGWLSVLALASLAFNVSGCASKEAKFTYTKLDGEEAYALTRVEGAATEISVPSTYEGLPVTKIEEGAFWNCTKLEKLTLPASITTIEGGAVNGVDTLEELHVENLVDWCAIEYEGMNGSGAAAATFALYEGETLVETIDGSEDRFDVLAEKELGYKLDQNTFCGCTSLKEITLWDSITQIEGFAFMNCASLEKFFSNGSVSTYGLYFVNCPVLKTVNLKGIKSTGNSGIFSECAALEAIVFPDTLTSFYSNVATDCPALKKMTFYSWNDNIQTNTDVFKSNNPSVEIEKIIA